MALRKIEDYEPQTKFSEADCVKLREQGGVELTQTQCLSIETALRQYEHLVFLKRRGEGKQLKKELVRLQAATTTFIKSISAVQNEPGHIWEYLLDKSNAEISCLESLLKECQQLQKETAKRKNDFFLDSLLGGLADVYTKATGRPATISKGAPTERDPSPGGKGGRFLRFARAAIKFLPENFQPKDKQLSGLGSRFDRMKKSGIRPYMWVGGPYPGLARPWYKNSDIHRLTKRGP